MAQHACTWHRSIYERPWQIYYKNYPWNKESKPPRSAEWRRDKVWIKTCEECGHSEEVTGIPISSRRAGLLEEGHDALAELTKEQRIEERFTMELVLRELVRVAKTTEEAPQPLANPGLRPEPVGSAAHSRLVNIAVGAGSDVLILAYVLEKMLKAGLIQIETRNVSKEEIDLQTNRVYLEAHAYEPIAQYLKAQDEDESRQEAVGLLTAYFDTRLPKPLNWPGDPARSEELYNSLEDHLQQQYNSLRTGLVARLFNTQTGKEIASSKAWGKYLTLLKLLVALQRQLAHGERELEQEFSFKALGDGNLLPSFRREIEGLLDCHFRELNLESFTNLVYAAGPFRVSYKGQPLTGRSNFPFVTITEDTVFEMRLTKLEAEQVLLIQNQAAFEEALRLGLWEEPVVSVLLDGYLAAEQREFLRKLLRREVAVGIWVDLDPIGLTIAEETADFLEREGAEYSLLLTDSRLIAGGEELSAPEKHELEIYCHSKNPRYLELGQALLEAGKKYPQTQIFSDFPQEAVLAALQGGKLWAES